GYVGRIAEDDIESLPEALAPAAGPESGPGREPEGLGIRRRNGHRASAGIDSQPPGGRQLAQQRQEQAARAGAQIERPQRFRPPRSRPLEGRLDQRLAVGPGIEGLGAEREAQAPEFAPAEDAR